MPSFPNGGIDQMENAIMRSQKAVALSNSLNEFGFNAAGLAVNTNRTLVKTLMLPMMEYSSSLGLIGLDTLNIYKKALSTILRQMLSASSSTSIAAMHRIALIPPFDDRVEFLSTCFYTRLHNDKDSSNIAASLYRNSVDCKSKTSLTAAFASKKTKWKSIIKRQPLGFFKGQPSSGKLIEDSKKKIEFMKSIKDMVQENETSVAAAIHIDVNETKPPALLGHKGIKKVTDRLVILKWLKGELVSTWPCYHRRWDPARPGRRKHAVACSGAETFLGELYPEHSKVTSFTVIDSLLNSLRERVNQDKVSAVATAIRMVYTGCLGFSINKRGELVPPAPTAPLMEANNAQEPPDPH